MNLKQLEDYTRYRLNDYEKPYAWLQKELHMYANEIERTICREGRVIEDSTTSSICNKSVVEDTLDYELDETIIWITSAKLTSSDQLLTKSTKMEMDRQYPGWRGGTSAEPTKYLLDYRHNYITLYPVPDASYTLNLSVIRYPEDEMALDTDEPEIPYEYHHMIVDGMCYMAFLKWGDRTYDAQKADVQLRVFKGALTGLKTKNILFRATDSTMGPHGGFL